MDENDFAKTPYFASILAFPYVEGAKVQLLRCIEAQASLKSCFTLIGFSKCFYETSSLLEHLSCIANYLNFTGEKSPIHQKIQDFRHIIRHDLRLEKSARSDKRRKQFNVPDDFSVLINFVDDGIQIGEKKLTYKDVDLFIKEAEAKFNGYEFRAGITINYD